MTNRTQKNTPVAKPVQKSAIQKARVHESTSPNLRIDSEVARSIRQHARAHMKTEVCGVLIGEIQDGIIDIQASIEALNAAQAGTHVTFTQDAWEAIYKVKDLEYPEERIVGWYHSHPGFGVFLSEHDTFIHRNFFSSADQVAWVYDPHTDEEGCFGWIDGEIHRVPAFSILDNSGDGLERTPRTSNQNSNADMDFDEEDHPSGRMERFGDQSKAAKPAPAWLRWTVTMLSYICAIAVGFLVSYMLFPRLLFVPVDPTTGEPLLTMPHARQAPAPAPDTSVKPAPKSSLNPNPGGPK